MTVDCHMHALGAHGVILGCVRALWSGRSRQAGVDHLFALVEAEAGTGLRLPASAIKGLDACRGYNDFNFIVRCRKLGFSGGPGWGGDVGDPGIPHCVHFREVAHVGKPYGRA